MVQSQIGDIAKTSGWRGDSHNKTAEPGTVTSLPVVDNTDPRGKNIRTSIDCYVTGTYIGKKGQSFEVKQRYTIFVSYSSNTQQETMQQARNELVKDFSSRYGKTFNVRDIFIPDFKPAPEEAAPIEMYRGSTTFKNRFPSRSQYDIDTERVMMKTNTANIKRRYGI